MVKSLFHLSQKKKKALVISARFLSEMKKYYNCCMAYGHFYPGNPFEIKFWPEIWEP